LIDSDLRSGRVLNLFPRLQVTATDFDTGAWLLYPSRRYLPSKVRCVIDFLKQEVARAGWSSASISQHSATSRRTHSQVD
jgi:DNA-binding transcriptional LysR family regulator